MRSAYQLTIYGCLILFCCAAMIPPALDLSLLKKINPSDPDVLYWRLISDSVLPVTIGLLIIVIVIERLLSVYRECKGTFYLSAALLLSTACTQLIKCIVKRDRPFFSYPLEINTPFSGETGLSFPSQHTSFAFASAIVISLAWRRPVVIVLMYAWAISVGWSRMYLGRHYPSDVIAGAAIGTACGMLGIWIVQRFRRQH